MDYNLPNFFADATRQKFRYETSKGLITTEDLWDLPLEGKSPCLDEIARNLYKQLKETAEDESFVKPSKKTPDPVLQHKFVVVKYIIDIRLAERDVAVKAKEAADKKQKILSLIEEKKDESLKQASIEELQQMLNSL